MSNKAIDAVKHCSKTKGGLRLLLVMIADGISKDTDVYPAKIETLMKDTNYNRRFVQRLINRGIASGELIVFPQGNRNSLFQIPMLDGEPGYDPQDCPVFAQRDESVEPEHYCIGRHTSLSVNREEQYRVWLGKNQSLRHRKTRRSQRSIDHPTAESPESSGLLTAPQRSIDHPTADDRPHQSGQLTTHYPSGTQVITPDMYQGIAPSLTKWLTQPENRELAQRAPYAERHDSYLAWCAAQGLEPAE